MKIHRRILAISLLFGGLVWTVDAFIDATIFSEGSFLELFLTDVPPHEIYFRLVLVVSFLLFGVIASHLVQQRLQHEAALETRTKELEETTAQLQKQYRTLFEEAPVMAAITQVKDDRPIIQDCNEQFVDTLGYDIETLQGRELTEFYTTSSREELLEEGGYDRALEGEFMRERREMLTADGETVETVLRAVPRTDDAGEIIGTLAMYLDITEREEVRRANEQLEEFTHIVSHDLRNPLNVVEGRLELAKEECESEHLDSIERALARMNTLIDDLLTLASEGDQLGPLSRVPLPDLVSQCWENVDTTGADIQIATDQVVKADESRFQQLFENLFRNAIEHGGEDITVTVGEVPDGFFVADDGSGIPEQHREEIFDTGFSTSEKGTGFGLSIVEDIAAAHDWELEIAESEAGGARVEFHDVETVGDATE